MNKCRQCGKCCKLFYINLNKDEYESSQFKTIFKDIDFIEDFSKASLCGANFLAKKKDGSCIYLENNSCNIYDQRPKVCRKYFCNSK